MAAYRILTKSTTGRVLDLHHFKAASDEAAILHAVRLYGQDPDREYEVWNGHGIVFKAPAKTGRNSD